VAQAGNPIRLTSDPTWGSGEAQIYGSETVTGWTRGAHPKMPNGGQVWMKEVDFLPRTLWMTAPNGNATRLKLARMTNWNEPDPNDVMSEWPTWENPEWWRNNNAGYSMKVGERELHLGIDTKNFTGSAEDYIGATVWTEWGIVMGSPYPAKSKALMPCNAAWRFAARGTTRSSKTSSRATATTWRINLSGSMSQASSGSSGSGSAGAFTCACRAMLTPTRSP
jgi:hypothetical protein